MRLNWSRCESLREPTRRQLGNHRLAVPPRISLIVKAAAIYTAVVDSRAAYRHVRHEKFAFRVSTLIYVLPRSFILRLLSLCVIREILHDKYLDTGCFFQRVCFLFAMPYCESVIKNTEFFDIPILRQNSLRIEVHMKSFICRKILNAIEGRCTAEIKSPERKCARVRVYTLFGQVLTRQVYIHTYIY